MTNIEELKREIIDNAEMLFLTVGFLNFEIADISKKMNIDSDVIKTCFISKSGLLLSILSELYVEVFGLNKSFSDVFLCVEKRKQLFLESMLLHERKIMLFVSLIERKEMKHMDDYLVKLLSRTCSLHYRIFLLQHSFADPIFMTVQRAKYSYYHLFNKFRTKGIFNSY